MAVVRQLKDFDKWQHDIQRQYAEIDEADGERKVKLIKDVLSQLESYGKWTSTTKEYWLQKRWSRNNSLKFGLFDLAD